MVQDHSSRYISKIFQHDIVNIFLSIGLNINFVLGAQKNHLIDMVLLSVHNIRFGRDLNIRWVLIRSVSLRLPDMYIANFIWTQIRRFP